MGKIANEERTREDMIKKKRGGIPGQNVLTTRGRSRGEGRNERNREDY